MAWSSFVRPVPVRHFLLDSKRLAAAVSDECE
jgi:hypothetical protein